MPDRLRLVEPGEWPVFGSVWTWGTEMHYVRLMALRRGPYQGPSDPSPTETIWFLDLQAGTVSKEWGWYTTEGSQWYCVDEGPPGTPRV